MYAELILPLALSGQYHYRIPDLGIFSESQILPGMRVVVSFGTKRFYTAVVRSLSSTLPEGVDEQDLKFIDSVLDQKPLIGEDEFALWEWMAHYYHASLGQVMRLALPAGLLPESQTLVSLCTDFQADRPLEAKALELLDVLAQAKGQTLTMEQLRHRLGYHCSRVFDLLYSLGAVQTEERLQTRYKPRVKVHIALAETYRSADGIALAETLLARAPKQLEMLGRWLILIEEHKLGPSDSIPREALAQSAKDLTLIRALVERGIFVLQSHADSRITMQQESYPNTEIGLAEELTRPVTLVYTRTTSAREEIVLAQVAQKISAGYQVLLLSPSAAAFPAQARFISRLSQACLGRVHFYHPLVNESKRTELYLHLSTSDEPCLVVGTRQAVFLPMRRLGLIIVEQEQEYLYKQQYSAPLFHARDVALWLGHKRGIPILLASETPSAEAIFNVLRGKYALIASNLAGEPCSQRVPAVDIKTINLSEQREQGRMPYGVSLSPPLREAIEATLRAGKRVLLLQNRRGYAPYAICDACGERIGCPHCDVSLTYHSSHRCMQCHYCGYEQPLPVACPHCGTRSVVYRRAEKPALRLVGYGIERVEEEVKELFDQAEVLRIDSESLQSNKRIQELHQRIEEGRVDIILGTQLIKGQPIWDNIGLIAVVQLDAILAYPDFRSEERAYQLLMQLMLHTSEATKGEATCQLILQTARPEHPFVDALRRRDYKGFIKEQLALRQLLRFAPFWRMTYVRLKAFDESVVMDIAQAFAELLKQRLGADRISDAQTPSVARIENQYIREIVCRRPFSESFHHEREAFASAMFELASLYPLSKRVRIIFDIDPL
ncbi:MAG: primosomal protein N' [Porphyromonadaceae bacterium]|nr:primosomal protein N' [Porphyromonadaceae bacterium]